ncbi:MAG: signal peptidase I [Lachnospiraceae bacterium]|nr:signal peptidase I [Lachnospiraceae bacterium]
MKILKILKSWLPYIIIIAVVLLVRIFLLINANIPTGSMNNTIPTESRIIGTKFAYWFSEPERGDIIVFDAPDKPGTLYVKRVIGIPGDKVEIKYESVSDGNSEFMSNVTYVNGERIEEPYLLSQQWRGGEGVYEVPEDSVFVMGDNRDNSLDARFWSNKYVSYDKILGKAYLIYWPLSEFGWLY